MTADQFSPIDAQQKEQLSETLNKTLQKRQDYAGTLKTGKK